MDASHARSSCTRHSSQRARFRFRKKAGITAAPLVRKEGVATRHCCHGDATLPYATARAHQLCASRLGALPGSWIVIDGATTPAHASALREEMSTLRLRQALQVHVRGDHTLHMREDEADAAGLPHLARSIALLKSIGHEIALAHGRDLTVAAKAQVAVYPGGGTGYKKHRDVSVEAQPRSRTMPSGRKPAMSNWRVFTAILYANPEWDERDGGKLRIHPDSTGVPPPPTPWGSLADAPTGPPRPTDVEPRGGRVVLFDSMLEHEVLPAFAPRHAVTLWIWREDGDEEKYYGS